MSKQPEPLFEVVVLRQAGDNPVRLADGTKVYFRGHEIEELEAFEHSAAYEHDKIVVTEIRLRIAGSQVRTVFADEVPKA